MVRARRGISEDATRATLYALALVAVTAAVFTGALELGTIEYDDPDYVTRNPHVQAGLTWEGLRWAATSSFAANWFPVTWASHMLDHELWGDDLAGHHATSVLLHIVNTLLLFALLGRATGALGRAAFVAALFALHPLHVESVAWLSERKDVLCAAFALASANVYVSYARAPSAPRMGGVALLLAASLASKPMSVTWPFLLLLLDVWPLGRVDLDALLKRGSSLRARLSGSKLLGLVTEKWPLFALSAVSCVITLSVQTGAMVTFEQFPLLQRIASVPYAYTTYIGMMLWPAEPIPLHVHPGRAISVGFGMGMGVALMAVTGWLMAIARRAPVVLVGWLWFLGTLVPVIGILQVGSQLVADRYTYLPLVGLFIAATWSVADALHTRAAPRWLGPLAAVLVLAACAGVSRAQLPYWTNTITLFARTVEVDPTNHVAHGLLARGYELNGEDERALEHYTRATQLRSYQHGNLFALGQRLASEGQYALAARAFEAQLAVKPGEANTRLELGALYQRAGNPAGAREQLELARELRPDSPEVLGNLAFFELSLKNFESAEARLREALALDSTYTPAYEAQAILAARRGDFGLAVELVDRACELDPENADLSELAAQLRAQRAMAEEGS